MAVKGSPDVNKPKRKGTNQKCKTHPWLSCWLAKDSSSNNRVPWLDFWWPTLERRLSPQSNCTVVSEHLDWEMQSHQCYNSRKPPGSTLWLRSCRSKIIYHTTTFCIVHWIRWTGDELLSRPILMYYHLEKISEILDRIHIFINKMNLNILSAKYRHGPETF